METTLNSNCDPAIAELISQLTTETASATHDDLGALAALHTRFQKLREEVNLTASADTRGQASQLAAKSEQLIEKLILGEADNAESGSSTGRAVC